MSLASKDLAGALRKHPVGFTAGFLALALGAAGYVRTGTLQELESQLESRTKEGMRQQSNITNGTRLDEQLAGLVAANQEIVSRAVDPRSLATNLQYFYELEAALGFKLIELKQGIPSPKEAGAAYQPIPYTVALEGRYEQAVQLLQALETGSPFVRFLGATLQPRSGASANPAPDASPMVTLSLSLELLGKS